MNALLTTTLSLLLGLFHCPLQAQPSADLIAAAALGETPRVLRLIGAGANLEARDANARTALLAATQANHIETARALIAAGADVNARDAIGDSPYLLAGARGHTEILRLTLAAGADLTSTNRYGGTALTPACHYGHVDNVRVLLASRIDINQVNRLGWTCLLEAVILGDGGARHIEIVRMLIAAGARLDLADAQGVTALTHARQRGQQTIADMLRKAGAK